MLAFCVSGVMYKVNRNVIMGKSQYDIEVLCRKYLDRAISEEELAEMLDYFKDHGIPEAFDQMLGQEFSNTMNNAPSEDIQELTNNVRFNLIHQIRSRKQPVRYHWLPYAAAVLLISMLGFFWFMSTQEATPDQHRTSEVAITPVGHKATITLADGRVLTLDESRDGIIVEGQQITYNDGASTVLALESSSPQQLTLSTPRGGMYKVTLSDGTVVWLNAESTLKYPSHFLEGERVVELEGEAYFDVKRVSDETSTQHFQPFKVVSAHQTITVLGTAFNVSAYKDEKEARTTLVEGKVRLESVQHRKNMVLLPGEQGKIGQDGVEKNKVDINDYIDWKNGEFIFRNETAKEVLHRIARWYDIDIEYSGYLPSDEIFSGSISRYSNLQTVLDIMQEAGDLAFEIKNRTVIVGNKLKKKN